MSRRALDRADARLRRRIVDVDEDVAARRGEEAQHAFAHRRPGRSWPVDDRISTPRPAAWGAALNMRPGVTPAGRSPATRAEGPVPDKSAARLAARLEAADRLQRVDEHELEVRERDDPAALVAHRRRVADLDEATSRSSFGLEQPALEEIASSPAAALDRELAQPPQVSRWAIIGCRPRNTSSSRAPRARAGR